jgi:ParB family chromosome partitioning protein
MENLSAGKIIEINVQLIIEPVDPMRSAFDVEKIADLAESIKKQGLINPITVRPVGDKFEIVAGHRRFKACVIAGVFTIPCVIRSMTDDEVFAMRAHENLFRDDVSPVDEAMYVGKIVGDDESKIPEIADKLNRSVAWVEDRLNILTYPDYFLAPLNEGKIKIGVAKALAQIGDEIYRRMFFNNAVRDGMTVWQADYYLRQWQNGVFKSGDEIISPELNPNRSATAEIKQQCEKCGQMAISPNLRTAFIHIECPPDIPLT